MCQIRENDGSDKLGVPYLTLDFIDLTMEDLEAELGDFREMNTLNDDRTNPYVRLPSSDEEEPERGSVDHNNFMPPQQRTYTDTIMPNGTLNDVDLSDLISLNNGRRPLPQLPISETFLLNIPQILSTMSRVTNNLHDQLGRH